MPIIQDGVAGLFSGYQASRQRARSFSPLMRRAPISGWTGTMSRIDKETVRLARNQQDWAEIWKSTLASGSPAVDFSRHAVLAYSTARTLARPVRPPRL